MWLDYSCVLLDLLCLLDGGVVGLGDVVNELTSHTIRTVAIGTVLLAQLSFIKHRDICFYHHVSLSMSKGALQYLKNSLEYKVPQYIINDSNLII